MGKYNNSHIYVDYDHPHSYWVAKEKAVGRRLLHFDSYYEYQVYLFLIRFYDQARVGVHPKVNILQDCNKTITWKPDFLVEDEDGLPFWYVEAKGYPTRVFWTKLNLLVQANEPVASKLTVVFKSYKDKPLGMMKQRYKPVDFCTFEVLQGRFNYG